MSDLQDQLITTEEVAAYYSVTPQTVRRWASCGAPAIKLPGQLRFQPEALRQWLLQESLREGRDGRGS